MPYDGLTIKAITTELNRDLFNSRIVKIHQPEKDELTLTIREPRGSSVRLLISANARWARMHLASERKSNPLTPSAFCMLLRKHLEGGKIKRIEQLDFERMVRIEIEVLDDFQEWKKRVLIGEFMGKHSNIILLNPETNLIINAIKTYGSNLSSYREILPGREYVNPPDQGKLNPLHTDFETFVRHMWNQTGEHTLASSLFSVYSGISPFSSRQICCLAGLNPDQPVIECGEYELSMIFNLLSDLINSIAEGNSTPCIAYQNNAQVEFAPYPLTGSGYACKTFASVNQACDAFYSEKLAALRLESARVNLSRNIKSFLDKAYKKKFYQEGDLANAKEAEKYKVWGELLTAYAHLLHKGKQTAELEDFYTGKMITVELDPRYTPIQNAQKYFKRYNKGRKAIKYLEKLMKENQLEINYLESVLLSIQQAETPVELEEIVEELEKEKYRKSGSRPKSKKQSLPRRFISSDELEILAGRNNRQNDFLTLKQADASDLWFHARNIPGSHIIVKTPGKLKNIIDMPDATIEEAAGLAAHFSKASQSEKVEVDYTFRANVRKPGNARPGMVIYDNYWTIVINPREERIQKLLKQ